MRIYSLIVSRVSSRERLTADTSCSQFDEQCLNPLRIERTEMPRGHMGIKSLPYFSVNSLHEIGWYHHPTMRVRDLDPTHRPFPLPHGRGGSAEDVVASTATGSRILQSLGLCVVHRYVPIH